MIFRQNKVSTKKFDVSGLHALKTHSVSNLYYFITNKLIFFFFRAVVNKLNISKQTKFYTSGDKAIRWNFAVS